MKFSANFNHCIKKLSIFNIFDPISMEDVNPAYKGEGFKDDARALASDWKTICNDFNGLISKPKKS